MLRLTLRHADAPWSEAECVQTADRIAGCGIRVAAAFVDGKSLEVYVESPTDGRPSDVASLVVDATGIDDFEATEVTPVAAFDAFARPDPSLVRTHRARIMRVRTHRSGWALRIEIRHRAGERLHAVDIAEHGESVCVSVVVGEPSTAASVVALRPVTSWIVVDLPAPLGARRIVARQPTA